MTPPAAVSLRPALDAVARAVDARFDRLLDVPDDARARLFEGMRHATIGGGKKMRALLTVAACDLFHVDRERALRVALAIEAVHSYSLVHEATAVLTGDSLFALAFEVLADPLTHEDPFVRSELVLELARASGPHGMAGGQMMDLEAEQASFDLATTTRLQQLKTGALIAF
ncbi:MAG: polyprenyl synthetase family protein, partial [Thermaurantiacus sp.]